MSFTTAGKNKALDAQAPDFISIHTGDPTDDGSALEVSGGTYARQACTFGAAAAGSKAMTGTETFNIPGSTIVTHYAIWSAGVCVDKGALPNGGETYNGDGTYELTSVTMTAI